MQKFIWKNAGSEYFTEVADRFFGCVSYVGNDMYGNEMYQASAHDKESKKELETSKYGLPFAYKGDAMESVEKAIRRAMK